MNIHGEKYSFSTYGDTGTGTAFANLITFDLALLELTCLPSIAHDLPLLKNIENPAMEKIILLYIASHKQIFIAMALLMQMTDILLLHDWQGWAHSYIPPRLLDIKLYALY